MNCKPGDIAIRVRAYADSYIPVGTLVRCISLIPGMAIMEGVTSNSTATDVWDVEWNGKRKAKDGILLGIPDAHLRPIRDSEGDDEMIRIAGIPHGEFA